MSLKNLFRSLGSLFTGSQHLGGIEISHSAIRYLALNAASKVTQKEIRLLPGVIEQGQIKNKAELIKGLKALHSQISKNEKDRININLIVPSGIVFAQPFSIPVLPEEELQEAVNLNVQMLSPNPIEESYFGWQEIERSDSQNKIHLLAAFAKSQFIKDYEVALENAGFHVFSIEFPAVSLSRLVARHWEKLEKAKHYLCLYLNSEGILMAILKNKNLYFSHFTPWLDILSGQDVKGSRPEFTQLKAFLSQEIQRVLNFYLSRHGEKLKNALIMSPLFKNEFSSLLKEQFAMQAENLSLPDFPTLSPSWFPALGASLRKVNTPENEAVSLSKTSAKHEYSQDRSLAFIRIWRKFALTQLVFIFLIFLAFDSFLAITERGSQGDGTQALENQYQVELSELRQQAQAFNLLVRQAGSLKDKEQNWATVIEEIRNTAGENILIQRIFADSGNSNILVNGNASNEGLALELKNRLQQNTRFENVSLPLSNLKTQPDGTIDFSLTMNLKAILGSSNIN